MYSLFIPNSLKDALAAHGCKIESALEFKKLKEYLDMSEFYRCQDQTRAVLAKLKQNWPDLPIYVPGENENADTVQLNELSVNSEGFDELYASTALSTNTVEASQMLECVVTVDGYLLLTESSVQLEDTFLERVIKALEDTKSIDDILKHEVSVYFCKI